MAKNFEFPLPLGLNSRGLNLYTDPRELGDDEFLYAKNLFPNVQGLTATRPAVAFSSTGPSLAGTTAAVPLGFALAAPETGMKFVALMSNGLPKASGVAFWRLYAWNEPSGASGYLSGANVVTKDLALPASTRPVFFNYRRQTFCFPCNGEEGFYVLYKAPGNAPASWIKRSYVLSAAEVAAVGLGSALPNVQTQNGGAVAPRVVFPYQDRMLLANFGPGSETVIGFTEVGNLSSWVAGNLAAYSYYASGNYVPPWVLTSPDLLAFNNPRSTNIPGIGAEEPITGGIEIQLQVVGTPVQAGALLLTSKGGYIITGAPLSYFDQSGMLPQGNLNISRINVNCGCTAPNTIVRTPYGIIWAGEDDVWMLDTGGIVPRRIGTKIRPALRDTPPADRWRWTACYVDGTYRLGICNSPSSGILATVLDLGSDFDYYWLDLRQMTEGGRPPDAVTARWWGPQKYNVSLMPTSGSQTFSALGPLVVDELSQPKRVCSLFVDVTGTVFGAYVVDSNNTKMPWDIGPKILQSPTTWSANNQVAVGETVLPSTPDGQMRVCTQAGVTGGSEPVWGSPTTNDNTVIWAVVQSVADTVQMGQPMSDVCYVDGANNDGEIQVDWRSKEYTLDQFAKKTIRRLAIASRSSTRQQLTCEFQQNMGAKVDDPTVVIGPLGATIPFNLSKRLSEQVSFRSLRPTDGSRAIDNTHRFRLFGQNVLVVDLTNNVITFQDGIGGGAKLIPVTVPTGIYATVNDLGAAIAAAIQATWRATGYGPAGNVVYTPGSSGAWPAKRQLLPRLIWSGFSALSRTLLLAFTTPGFLGCLPLIGFDQVGSSGGTTLPNGIIDNGTIYGTEFVPPINPARWSLISAEVNGRQWRREPLSNTEE